jgi:uncharacterized lipoprotein YehR (DUF1307 family)
MQKTCSFKKKQKLTVLLVSLAVTTDKTQSNRYNGNFNSQQLLLSVNFTVFLTVTVTSPSFNSAPGVSFSV